MGRNQELGRYGEELAARYLADQGMELLDRNWRCGAGELDIVAQDGPHIVCVEVKTRTGEGYGHPAEAVAGQKLRRQYILAAEWCASNGRRFRDVRIDVVAIVLRAGGPSIEHYRAVVQ